MCTRKALRGAVTASTLALCIAAGVGIAAAAPVQTGLVQPQDDWDHFLQKVEYSGVTLEAGTDLIAS